MSLLEDIYLQDEANEVQDLERVIEGDEYDERPRSPYGDESDGGNKEDEAEEDKRRVDPSSTKTKRVTKNPRFILNPARLTGPRGIQVIPDHFKDFKFKGKGHEKEDLDIVLKKLEHWAYRLYPKFQFQDCLKKIETLGKKRPVMVHLHKIRTDQFLSEETVVQKDSSDDEAQPPQEEDEFDKLLQQQIEKARATPAPGSVKKVIDKGDQWARVMETPNKDRSLLPMPKATSSPSISDEQKERMLRNRRLAEERRLARLKQTSLDNSNISNSTTNTIIEIDEPEIVKEKTNDVNNVIEINDEVIPKKNRSHVIDSSDSEDDCNVMAVNESIVVDVHNNSNKQNDDDKMIEDKPKEVSVGDNDIEEMTVDDEHSDVVQSVLDDKTVDNSKSSHDKIVDSSKSSDDKIVVDSKSNNDKNNSINVEEKCDDDNIIDKDIDNLTGEKDNHKILDEVSDKNIKDVESNKMPANNDEVVEVSNEINKELPQSPNSPKEDNKQPKDNAAEEFTEDIMDVDFSDDF